MLRVSAAMIALALFTVSLLAQAPKAISKLELKAEPDSYADLVQLLHGKKVKFPNSLKDTPLRTVKELLEKEFAIKIVVREDLFKLEGSPDGEIMDRKFKLDTNFSGLSLEAFLRVMLPDINCAFLVRKDYIEITTNSVKSTYIEDPLAAKFRKGEIELPAIVRDTPLVCAIIKDRHFDSVLTELADTYGFTVIIAVQAAEEAKSPVSARLMNVPFPTALEVLALNAGLRVVRRENTFIVTTVDHAANLKAKALKPAKK